MKFAISNWIYGDESLEVTFQRLERYGYDGIEIRGEPSFYPADEVKALCKKYGITVSSVAGMYEWPNPDRDLANPDPRVRHAAVDYLIGAVEWAAELSAPMVVVVPSAVSKTSPVGVGDSPEDWEQRKQHEWALAVESLQEVSKTAEREGIWLAIEPINRYETFLVNNVEQVQKMIGEINSSTAKILLDTFHMNIEEVDPAEAVKKAGSKLVNVQIADSNRQAVGQGHTNFPSIVHALKEINYQYALTLEPLPPLPNPYFAIRMPGLQGLRDEYAQVCITRLKEYIQRD